MDSKFILTSYKEWSKYSTPKFDRVFEAAAPSFYGPETYKKGQTWNTSNAPHVEFQFQTAEPKMEITIAKDENFTQTLPGWNKTPFDKPTADIPETGANKISYDQAQNIYTISIPQEENVNYHIRVTTIDENGERAESATLTGLLGSLQLDPNSSIPEDAQLDPLFVEKVIAAADRQCDIMTHKVGSGPYLVYKVTEEKDPDTGEIKNKVVLHPGGLRSFALSDVIATSGGFIDSNAQGVYYFNSIGGMACKIWICSGDSTIYLKPIEQTSAAASTEASAVLKSSEPSAEGQYYKLSWVCNEKWVASNILRVTLVGGPEGEKTMGYLDKAAGADEFALMTWLTRNAKNGTGANGSAGGTNPGSTLEARYDGPVYKVNPGKILSVAGDLWDAMEDTLTTGSGTDEEMLTNAIKGLDPIELFLLTQLWNQNAWTGNSDWWWNSEGLSEFSGFPNQTPLYDQADIDTDDAFSSSSDIVEYFPSAKKPSLLVDMFWELEDSNEQEIKFPFEKMLREKYKALQNTEKYPKKFYRIVSSATGKVILNTDTKNQYTQNFSDQSDWFYLSSAAERSIQELDGYAASDTWKD
jgi:hypothetical protein